MCSDHCSVTELDSQIPDDYTSWKTIEITAVALVDAVFAKESHGDCLLYTSDAADDVSTV